MRPYGIVGTRCKNHRVAVAAQHAVHGLLAAPPRAVHALAVPRLTIDVRRGATWHSRDAAVFVIGEVRAAEDEDDH